MILKNENSCFYFNFYLFFENFIQVNNVSKSYPLLTAQLPEGPISHLLPTSGFIY